MPDSSLIEAARAWVIEKYPYNRGHLVRSLEWLDRIAPESSEAVRLATLTHDMERAFPGPDQPVVKKLEDDPVYNKAHSDRSARIVGEWLRQQRADPALVEKVEQLIRVHEDGGSAEANLVQAADSLSFLDTNVDLFLGFVQSGRFPAADVKWKFEYSYNRIQVPHAKSLARPLLDGALKKLEELDP
jgi:Domain of unknown function (DUF4202)